MENDFPDDAANFERQHHLLQRIQEETAPYRTCADFIGPTLLQVDAIVSDYGMDADRAHMISPGHDDHRC